MNNLPRVNSTIKVNLRRFHVSMEFADFFQKLILILFARNRGILLIQTSLNKLNYDNQQKKSQKTPSFKGVHNF